jgi:UPF0042 nucleotide-binding protein
MSAGRLVLVSGVSGAGKTLALQTLEDIGYFCIDNLPPSMLRALRERVATGQRVAVVVDTRANEPLEDAEQTALQMRADGVPLEVLFLDCADEVLVRRFKETRRPHPLASREPSLPKAIHAERALLAPLKAIADHTLDTTLFKPQDLREAIRQLYADEKAQPPLRVRIVSFGFKYGVPADADLVFDVRFLRNPHYVPRLKPKPGTDPAVRDLCAERRRNAGVSGDGAKLFGVPTAPLRAGRQSVPHCGDWLHGRTPSVSGAERSPAAVVYRARLPRDGGTPRLDAGGGIACATDAGVG